MGVLWNRNPSAVIGIISGIIILITLLILGILHFTGRTPSPPTPHPIPASIPKHFLPIHLRHLH
jgi:hypothetical protein